MEPRDLLQALVLIQEISQVQKLLAISPEAPWLGGRLSVTFH